MTSKDDLLREGRELLKKGQELLDKAEAMSKPEPVTACVGDEVITESGQQTYVVAPPRDENVICLILSKSNFGSSWTANPRSLTTLDGRKIDRVVPFRIKKVVTEFSRWYVCDGAHQSYDNGDTRVCGDLSRLKRCCESAAKSLWPWYDGPAYVVEE